jgi:hypothetical protein
VLFDPSEVSIAKKNTSLQLMVIQLVRFLLKAYQTITMGSINAIIKLNIDKLPTDCRARIIIGQNAKMQVAKVNRDFCILG